MNIAPLFLALLLGVASPSPSPSPTPSAEVMVPIGDAKVSAHDFAEFTTKVFSVYLKLKNSPITGEEIDKAPSEMPAADPIYHYAGFTTQNGTTHITIWLAKNLEKMQAITAMNAAGALGVMDAGVGGDTFDALYAKAKAADEAAGPTAKDPWAHRKDLAETIAATIMAILSK